MLPTAHPTGRRHQLTLLGGGPATVLMVHGYGCHQGMWRRLAPLLAQGWRVALLDLAGFGAAQQGSYDPQRHADLHGHAQDVLAVAGLLDGPLVALGHSVGATIAMLSAALDPGRFAALALLSPSPCFLNDGAYRGGFEADSLQALLDGQRHDMQAWARQVAALVAGDAPGWSALTAELAGSFCQADPRAAEQLARATFLGDHRALLTAMRVPSLVLQSARDAIAPPAVGRWMAERLPDCQLVEIDTDGHAPHLTAPRDCALALENWLQALQARGTLPARA